MARSSKNDPGQRPVITVSDGTLIPLKGDKGVLSAWNISFFGAVAILIALPLSAAVAVAGGSGDTVALCFRPSVTQGVSVP